MKTRNWIALTALGLFGLATLIFRPVTNPKEKDCSTLKGTVKEIYESGVKDVAFKLQGHDEEFYINRGLERGLDLKKLKAELINKDILIKYPKQWTPLDPFSSLRHVSKIELDGQTIFSELTEESHAAHNKGL
jgi:hypothetical protein